jgi:hypothetical protein
MCEQLSTLNGPDFLQAVAEAELASGNAINADYFNQRAREWRQDRADLDRANQRIHEQNIALDKARAGVRAATAQLQAVA